MQCSPESCIWTQRVVEPSKHATHNGGMLHMTALRVLHLVQQE